MSFLPYLSDTVLLEGFSGGLHYPEFVRNLWHSTYEVIPDDATIKDAVRDGVISPTERKTVMEPKPLKERQTQLLSILREYVSKHFPDHLELLS